VNIEDHNCGMCGKQATKVHKSFPAPPRAIFICDDCADQKDYILDTLSPDLILSEEAQEKIKKRNYQKRHRYIKSNNIKLSSKTKKIIQKQEPNLNSDNQGNISLNFLINHFYTYFI